MHPRHHNENERMTGTTGRGSIKVRESVSSGDKGKGKEKRVSDGRRIKPLPTQHEMTMMEKLLFSRDCADVVFELTNGKTISAHKCVLAVASNPLKALVTGPWLENQNDKGVCIVKVEHSEAAVKVMLHYIYVGDLPPIDFIPSPENALADSYLELLDLAAQYDLPDLASSCVAMGIELLTNETSCGAVKHVKYLYEADIVVPLTIAAYYHEQSYLKEACVEYIKFKGPSITMSDAFIELKTSHPDIWTSLREDLGVPDQA
jgi:hypothetical protein